MAEKDNQFQGVVESLLKGMEQYTCYCKMPGGFKITLQYCLFEIRCNADSLSKLRKYHSIDAIKVSGGIR